MILPTFNNSLQAWDRFWGCVTRANQRNKMEYHRRLVAAIVAFRLNDYVKHVGGDGDHRKVVERELAELLAQSEYAGQSGAELAAVTEREVQMRMPGDTVWHDLACLAHAVHFPVQARLMVNWQRGGSSEYIPSLMKQFPFLNQPIEAVAPSNIAAPPTGMGRLSRELRGMLSERLQLLSLPKIRYAFSDTSPPFLATRREGDAGVSVLPEGWKPGTEERV